MPQEGGTSIAVVKSMGESKSGNNWRFETDKGVFNFAKKTFPEMPNLGIGKPWFFHWSWFEIPNSQGKKMRMVNDYRIPGPNDKDFETTPGGPAMSREEVARKAAETRTVTPPVKPPQQPVQRLPHEEKPPIEGWRMGQALNIGVLMAGQLGVGPDSESYWPTVFECADEALQATSTYEKGAGKFPKINRVPF